MNKSYKSLNPEKDFRQQIKSIFKSCKIQQGILIITDNLIDFFFKKKN